MATEGETCCLYETPVAVDRHRRKTSVSTSGATAEFYRMRYGYGNGPALTALKKASSEVRALLRDALMASHGPRAPYNPQCCVRHGLALMMRLRQCPSQGLVRAHRKAFCFTCMPCPRVAGRALGALDAGPVNAQRRAERLAAPGPKLVPDAGRAARGLLWRRRGRCVAWQIGGGAMHMGAL